MKKLNIHHIITLRGTNLDEVFETPGPDALVGWKLSRELVADGYYEFSQTWDYAEHWAVTQARKMDWGIIIHEIDKIPFTSVKACYKYWKSDRRKHDWELAKQDEEAWGMEGVDPRTLGGDGLAMMYGLES